MTTDPLMTVEQVAARLQVGAETIRRWLRTGKLRGVRLGATKAGWRIAVSEIERIERGG